MAVIAFDLDDTLYKERDFAISGYRAVCKHLSDRISFDTNKAVDAMSSALIAHENPFDALYEYLDRELYISELLEIYRFHKPTLEVDGVVLELLESLVNRGVRLALVTDGRSVTQRNKIEALGIGKFFPEVDIYISEETGYEKNTGVPFRKIMERYPDEETYVYIGDNPAKDLDAPEKLGWRCFLLRDWESVNIHSQKCDKDVKFLDELNVSSVMSTLEYTK